jgi:hypothetical protein
MNPMDATLPCGEYVGKESRPSVYRPDPGDCKRHIVPMYLENRSYHTDLRSNVVSFIESGKSETDVARLDECDEVTGS